MHDTFDGIYDRRGLFYSKLLAYYIFNDFELCFSDSVRVYFYWRQRFSNWN